MKTNYILVLLFLFSTSINANNKEPYQVLNNYVQFINESIHGLRIVHGLLENYNQDLNKYVDLESTQINAYSNKHLPKNIFEDPEGWFFVDTPSPEELFAQLKEESFIFGEVNQKILLDQAFELRKVYTALNALRFEIETYMQTHGLDEEKHQKNVFTLLEKGVQLFEAFYLGQNELYDLLENQFNQLYPSSEPADHKFELMERIHSACFSFMEALRYKNDFQIKGSIDRINQQRRSIQASALSFDSNKKIFSKWDSFVKEANTFYTHAIVPSDHKLYGKFYYYHNKVLVPYMNWQGLGFTRFMNEILDQEEAPFLHFLEVPVFLQVIYPKKLDPIEHLAASDSNIELLPEKLKDREVVVRNHTMYVDQYLLEVKVYDHKIEDGDIISLNFNGDWILEEYTLSAKPKTFKLKINESGKNYFLLHALNLGKRPPNTMALSYTYRGQKETIVLSSSLDESEMIEIIYKPAKD